MVQKPKNQSGIVYPIHLQGFLHPMLQGNGGFPKTSTRNVSQRWRTETRLQDQWNEGRWRSRQNGIPQNCNKVGPRGDRYKWSEGHG